MELKDIVKLDLKCSKIEAEEELIDLGISKATMDILAYCNLVEIPKGLINTVANLAVDIISKKVNCDNSSDNLKSIQEGDTTLTFKDSIENKDIKDYYNILNNFRRADF
ncbi:MAG: hypothetical protein ACRDCB_05960 [Clostridium sp.]|uniref:hypothetical protein n=1 Tax=Clostridium TaxID=1485 RepID=UPI0018844C17|nr:hypothetical protein [Clostridium chrysemydis]